MAARQRLDRPDIGLGRLSRMVGRLEERRDTSRKPARPNADAVVQERGSRLACYLEDSRPQRRANPAAAFNSSVVMPRPR